MLKELFTNQLTLGCAQAAVAILLALAVMLLARQREIHLERETIVALVRGSYRLRRSDRSWCFCCEGQRGPASFCLHR